MLSIWVYPREMTKKSTVPRQFSTEAESTHLINIYDSVV